MRKSKCVYCVDGMVLNKETNEIIAGCFCAIDAWDETVRCKKGWCKYYRRKQESEVNNEASSKL